MNKFLALLFCCACSASFAQAPYTHRLIAKEIQRLGGESEAPSALVLVVFSGENFGPPQFEMLSHLPEIREFHAWQTRGDANSLKYLANSNIERIDLHSDSEAAKGIAHLKQCKKLAEIYLKDVSLDKKTAEALGKLPSLSRLYMENIDLEDGAVELLLELSSRCLVGLLSTRSKLSDSLQETFDRNQERMEERLLSNPASTK